MTPNKKKAAGGFGTHVASKGQHHGIRPSIKATIVWQALRRVLPVAVAGWLIQRGGLRHV